MNWCVDWLGPYTSGPSSSHIAWMRLYDVSGVLGGDTGANTPAMVSGNVGYPYVIYAGRGYQTWNQPGVGTVAASYDIRTGEIYYQIPVSQGGATPAIVAEVPQSTDFNGAVITPSYELIAGTVPASSSGHRITLSQLIKIDPFTGLVTLNVTGMVGDFYNGQYVLSVQNLGTTANPNYRLINWTIAGTSSNFTSRVISNVTTTLNAVPQLVDWDAGIGVVVNRFGEGNIYGGNPVAYNLVTGQVLWNITTGIETPFGGGGQGAATMDNGKVFIGMEDGWWDAFDEHTGALLWKTPNMAETSPWGEFWSYSAASHDGILYTNSYVGAIAFNESNGKIIWKTPSYAVPYETPYSGEYSWHSSSIVADGKYYSFTCEHSPTQPLTRGWKFYCLNATTGAEIWSILGTQRDSRNFDGAIADGYLSVYDQYIDATTIYGKGQSTTTVSTPDVAVPQGTEVIIKGSVLDMSPAQPNTPCVSSASMATQMEYLHYGQPIGGIWGNETITGVPVTLKAIDSNNNLLDVGTTTTNGYYGTYSISWTPPNPGKYEILSSFAGDDSYGSSGASAGLFVNTAPTSTPTTTTSPASNLATTTDLMLYILASAIALIITIAIATLLLFRKK